MLSVRYLEMVTIGSYLLQMKGEGDGNHVLGTEVCSLLYTSHITRG